MNMNKKWMMLILLLLGAMIASGCGISKEQMIAYNEANDNFPEGNTGRGKEMCACRVCHG